MERDRARHREERERAGRERDEEREAAEAEHTAALGALRAGHAERIADMEGQVRRSDEAREKEGGDWNAELRDALERERDVVKKMVALEDEKQTLLSQVSTLQAQSTSLQSRLESVSETATTASEREREGRRPPRRCPLPACQADRSAQLEGGGAGAHCRRAWGGPGRRQAEGPIERQRRRQSARGDRRSRSDRVFAPLKA